jgi:hypothetical protein
MFSELAICVPFVFFAIYSHLFHKTWKSPNVKVA